MQNLVGAQMERSELPNTELKLLLEYIPATGAFIWRQQRGRQRAGTAAGTVIKGVRWIRLKTRLFRASDVAYFWMTGDWRPTDCADGDGNNLRWANIAVSAKREIAQTVQTPYTYIWKSGDGWKIAGNMGVTLAEVWKIVGVSEPNHLQEESVHGI